MDEFKIQNNILTENLPKTAGVYSFLDNNPSTDSKNSLQVNSGQGEIIYIGKAINIKDRVKSHFLQPSYRDNLFMSKVTKIGFIETGSEIEALILEANLIKKHQPKFNVVWKDDKNYFYVALRYFIPQGKLKKDKMPYIFITHQKQDKNTEYIGPFIEGNAIKKSLKFLRKAFPFYTSANHPKQKCTWCHLGLCPGPELFENPPSPTRTTPRATARRESTAGLREYKKNIKKLTLILKGEKKNVLSSLKKEMNETSKKNNFEEAAKIRDKMHALENIMAHKNVISSQATENTGWEKTNTILKRLLNLKNDVSRIECYDISNIQGKQAVGSMVVFTNGQPDKSQYKKFKIRMENEPNDIAMLKEVFTRRLSHKEWTLPEVMLIDGGIAQINIAIKMKNSDKDTKYIKAISIAKRNKELYIEGIKKPLLLKNLHQSIYNLIIHLDDEAHRFAITYHKKLRKQELGLDNR